MVTLLVPERYVMVGSLGFPVPALLCVFVSAVAGAKFLAELEPCGLGERVQAVSCVARSLCGILVSGTGGVSGSGERIME